MTGDTVERMARAMFNTGINIGCSTWPDDQLETAKELAEAALEASGIADLRAENERLKEALAAGARSDETRNAAQSEGRQSGGEAVTPNPHRETPSD